MTDITAASGIDAAARLRLPDELHAAVDAAMNEAREGRWASRIWERDASLWTSDERVAGLIADRLGWLDAPTTFQEQVEELTGFAEGIVESGFRLGLVCGMGGSSLAPEVLAHAFPRAAHGIPVRVLDSTDPDAVRGAAGGIDDAETLHLIATKSGTTTETLAFLAYLWELAEKRTGLLHHAQTGDGFVAITDPGESERAIPHTDAFREIFRNPKDVGGRYSALTYVGLVPGSLQGLDIQELLRDAQLMAERCVIDDGMNPGLLLGVTMGSLAAAGRDKLTFVLEPALATFGAWAEQLIAESTGKNGTGIVPVDGESLGGPEVYGSDRVFVRLGRESSDWWATTDAALERLAEAGHPIVDVPLRGGEWLGGEFFRWEFATAVAGAVLKVDPFDEPNVTESKENTKGVLQRFHDDGALPSEPPLVEHGRLRLIGDAALRLTGATTDVRSELRRHLERAKPNGYHAIQAYIAPSEARSQQLRDIQRLLRDRTKRATTLGYGPRYLHSTGQLHKGGPRTGCFLQLVAGHPNDLPIPGRKETFGTLIDAQALGDFASLQSHELPVLRVHLSDDPDAGLAELHDELLAALS